MTFKNFELIESICEANKYGDWESTLEIIKNMEIFIFCVFILTNKFALN